MRQRRRKVEAVAGQTVVPVAKPTAPALPERVFAATRASTALRLGGLVAAVVISVALIVAWVSWQARATALAQAETLSRNLVVTLEQHTARTIEAADMGLRFAESRIRVRGGLRQVDSTVAHQLLKELTANSPQVRSLFVVDETGTVLHDSAALPARNGGSLADRAYFVAHRDRPDAGLFIDKVYRSRVNGRWSMFMSRRVSNPDGSFAGIIVATLDPDYFRRFYERIDVGSQGSVTLITDAGEVLIRNPWRDEQIGSSIAQSPLFRDHLKVSDSGTYQSVSIIDGATRIFAYRRVRGLSMIAVTGISKDEVLVTWWRQTGALVGAAVVVLALTGLLAWLLARALAQHEAARSLFQAVFDHSTDGLFVNRLGADGRFRIETFNAAAEAALGLPVAAAAGRTLEAVLSPGKALQVEADLARCVQAGAPLRFEDDRVLDGARQTWEVVQLPLRNAEGQVDRVFVSTRDITHLKAAETRARAAAAEAREANRMLLLAEEMAHVGHWRVELGSGETTWSDEVFRIYGFDRDAHTPTLDGAVAAYHPDDRAAVAACVDQAIAGRGAFEFAHRLVRPNGEERAVVVRGRCEADEASGEVRALFGAMLDVTDLRRAEQGLAEKSAHLAATLDNMDQGLVMVGPDGRVRVSNRRFAELLDLSPGLLAEGPDFEDVLDHLANRGEFAGTDPSFQSLVRDRGAPLTLGTYERRRPNGTVLEVQTTALPGGGVVRTYADITARRAAEAAVAESEARYRLLSEHATDMIVHADLDTTRRYASPASRELLGYEPEELIGTRPLDGVHPEDAAAYAQKIDDLVHERTEVLKSTQRYRRKNGTWVWVDVNTRLVRDPNGRATGYVAALRDVGDRVTAETAMRESEARYRLLADNASDVIMLEAPGEGRACSYVSPSVRAVLGYEPDEFASLASVDLIHPEDLTRVAALYAAIGSHKPEAVSVHRLRHKDGRWVWVEIVFKAMRDEASGAPAVLGAIRDVTERQRQAEHLERAKAAAEAGARVKAEFLANMSHELRTPLTGMLGVHDLLRGDPALTERQKRFVELAQESGHALLTIVNDVLDFSKIEAGQMSIERAPFSLRDLVESCRRLGAEARKVQSVRLAAHVAEDVPDLLLGDPTRVRQILLNLVTNGVKFTAEGEVVIRAVAQAGRLRLEVSDTGLGVPPEAVPHLFERFAQGDGSTARRFGGTGLGLAICKRLVELMGGEIGVESTLGQGSLFWFELPLVAAEGERRRASRPAALATAAANRSLRILLAEDNVINQEIIQTALERKGHRVTLAGDGAAALDAFGAGGFDIVLMDVQMPGTDGLVATARLRALERAEGRAPTPVVALTANAMAEDVARCRAAGMDAHVAKPVDWGRLFATLDTLCGAAGPDVAGPAGADSAAAPVLDENALDGLASLMGRDRVGELLVSFRREAERRLSLMEAPDAPPDKVAQQAHSLVSLAGQLGFAELSSLCARVEEQSLRRGGTHDLALLRQVAERAMTAAGRSSYARAAA